MVSVDLHPLNALLPHEETDASYRQALKKEMAENRYVRPIVADRQSGTVLDGHHRLHAARELGLVRIPVVFLDYGDGAIVVESWRAGSPVAKKDVLDRAKEGSLFAPKTTKHMFQGRHVSLLAADVRVPFEDLI